MKKVPQPADMKAAAVHDNGSLPDSSEPQDLPVFPGTEQPRSLGDILRDAELVDSKNAGPDDTDREVPTEAAKPRRSKKPSRAQARRFARERALQAIYQWDVTAGQSTLVRQEFLDAQDMSRVDVDYFVLIFNGVSQSPQPLDDALQPCLDRPIENLDPIERGVLRIAAFELSQRPDVPARVVINESIEITKRFGADKGHHYVNGVLDKLGKALRPLEMKAR